MKLNPTFVCGILVVFLSGCGDSEKSTEAADPVPAAPRATASTSPEKPANPQPQIRILRPEPADGSYETVDAYTEQFFTGDLAELHARFSSEMQESFSLDRLVKMRLFVETTYGKEVKKLGQDHRAQEDYRGFVRWSEFEHHDGVIEIQWILREDDSIAGFFVQPAKKKGGEEPS